MSVAGGTILFAAGRAGSPDRHTVMLDRFRAAGHKVVAPHFPVIEDTRPRPAEMLSRAATLREALDKEGVTGPVTGIGHSIGGTILMAMAGAQAWTGPNQQLPMARDERLVRLVLLTPPLGFVSAPHALDELTCPIMLRAGEDDLLIPPSTYTRFVHKLSARLSINYSVVRGADHFSFMDTRPPDSPECMADAEAFRAQLAEEILVFHG